ncbi:PREDICTED: xaa-Pro aminopeptidase 1-like [Fragaria vesca subsp. vesca]
MSELALGFQVLSFCYGLRSEFIVKCYMRRTFISGFTGSVGIVVVTKDKAALWTDGRSFLQAEKH